MINRLDNHHDPFEAWDVLSEVTGDLAFDVGANIGQSTRVLAKGFRRVVAFEPNPESYHILSGEMPIHVETYNVAVSSVDGAISLDVAEASILTGQYVTGEGLAWGALTQKVEVPAYTLDTLAEKHGYPEFLKIDTEGHEIEVLKGGQKLLAFHPVVMVEVHKKENEGPCRELLSMYELQKIEHPLRLESFFRQNHFWLLGR